MGGEKTGTCLRKGKEECPQGLKPGCCRPLMSELKLRPPRQHLRCFLDERNRDCTKGTIDVWRTATYSAWAFPPRRTASQGARVPERPQPRDFSSLVRSVFDRQLQGYGLTPREACVAELVLSGLSNKEIAARCRISELTVKDHLKHIYQKTGAHQRTALLARLLGTLAG